MQRFKLFVALVAACWLGLVLTFAWPAIAGSFGGGAGARNATVTGTVTATQGTAAAITAPWPAQLSDGTNALGTSGNPIRTDTTASTTQPVSGTVTVTQGTAAAIGAPWPAILSDGAAALGTAGNPIRIDTTAGTTQPVSGTVAVSAVTTLPDVTLAAASKTQVVGSTGVVGGAPGVGADVTIVADCAANGTTTFTPTAGTYNVCATTSGAAALLYLCYVDDDGAGTNCLTEGEPFGASPTAPDCRVRRLANVAHYCRGDAAADFTLVPLTY